VDAQKFIQAIAEIHRQPRQKDSHMKFLKASEVSARWGGTVSTGTLANWRTQKRGPAYVKIGSRVLYPLDKLEEWEAAGLRAATANDNNTERESNQ